MQAYYRISFEGSFEVYLSVQIPTALLQVGSRTMESKLQFRSTHTVPGALRSRNVFQYRRLRRR